MNPKCRSIYFDQWSSYRFGFPSEVKKEIDWSQKFLYEDTVAKDSTLRYIAIGWGDKGFYLDTPTWADLKFSTAFKAAFWLGNSAIHTTFIKK